MLLTHDAEKTTMTDRPTAQWQHPHLLLQLQQLWSLRKPVSPPVTITVPHWTCRLIAR